MRSDLQPALANQTALKVISGVTNLNATHVVDMLTLAAVPHILFVNLRMADIR
jgi:hypothetical protein